MKMYEKIVNLRIVLEKAEDIVDWRYAATTDALREFYNAYPRPKPLRLELFEPHGRTILSMGADELKEPPSKKIVLTLEVSDEGAANFAKMSRDAQTALAYEMALQGEEVWGVGFTRLTIEETT